MAIIRQFADFLTGLLPPVKAAQKPAIHPPGWGGDYGDPPPYPVVKVPTLYRHSPPVYVAVTTKAQRVAQYQFELFRRKTEDRMQIYSHPILNLLERPNPRQSGSELLELTVSDGELNGNAYWWLAGNARGLPVEMWRLNPRLVRLARDSMNHTVGYIYEVPQGPQIPLHVDEILHFRKANPDDQDWGYGVPPLHTASIPAATGYAMDMWNRTSFAGSSGTGSVAIPAGIVYLPQYLDEADYDRIKQEWRREYGGTERKTAFLRTGEANFQKIGLDARELDYIESRKLTTQDVYAIYGCWHLIAILNNVATDVAKMAERSYLEETIQPIINSIGRVLTQFLTPFFGKNLIVEGPNVSPRDQALLMQQRALDREPMTLNEVREADDLEPLPGGDDIGWLHYKNNVIMLPSEAELQQEMQPEPAPIPPQFNQPPEDDDDQPPSDDRPPEDQADDAANQGSEMGDDIGESTNRARADLTDMVKELKTWRQFTLKRMPQ